MGYACPVCESPQADGEHLANHMAFTAMLHGNGHEAWLDEHAPGWADRDPDALSSALVEHAEETDHETVFDDTTGDSPEVDVGPDHRHGAGHGRLAGDDPARNLDPETERIVEEARELTRERREQASDTDEGREE